MIENKNKNKTKNKIIQQRKSSLAKRRTWTIFTEGRLFNRPLRHEAKDNVKWENYYI